LVGRQVSDDLRTLDSHGVVHSCRLRAKQGKDICNLWGLNEWGAGCRQRQPEAHLELVKEQMPTIEAYRGGKGIFDYGAVLPTYIPKMLGIYGAALSTSQIKDVVVLKISPPIVHEDKNPEPLEYEESDGEAFFPGYCRIPSPEDLLAEAQRKDALLRKLTDREKRLVELKEAGHSIDAIAEQLGCSKRTVNNEWKKVFEKCQHAIAA
jgi:DNA-binding CsgD family transcriptional regulator